MEPLRGTRAVGVTRHVACPAVGLMVPPKTVYPPGLIHEQREPTDGYWYTAYWLPPEEPEE